MIQDVKNTADLALVLSMSHDKPAQEAVTAAAEAKVAATEAKAAATETRAAVDDAQEILDNIPDDYSDLSDAVSDLNGAIYPMMPRGYTAVQRAQLRKFERELYAGKTVTVE